MLEIIPAKMETEQNNSITRLKNSRHSLTNRIDQGLDKAIEKRGKNFQVQKTNMQKVENTNATERSFLEFSCID